MGRRRKRSTSETSEEYDRRKRRHIESSQQKEKDREERARRRSRERRKRSEERKNNTTRSDVKVVKSKEDVRKKNSKDGKDNKIRRTRSKSGEREEKYRKEKKERPPDVDKDGHLVYRKGDVVKGPHSGQTFEILSDLGEGTFGKVVEVRDSKEKTFALKIIRNVAKYRAAAKYEIRVLRKLRDADPKGEHLVIPLLDHFDYYGHPCLVFPLLGQSVFDFLKDNNYYPYPLEHVRQISYQLIKSVLFMHRQKLTHTDLKPENLMFKYRGYSTQRDTKGNKYRVVDNASVVLIDLGGATFEDEQHTTIVSTRHYRAPEVILELGWSYPCDVWSVGCIMFELYTSYTLFQTHDSREHLAIMEKALGQIPLSLGEKTKTRYFKDGRLQWDDKYEGAQYVREKCHNLRHHQLQKTKDTDDLFDLIELMLEYDPDKRIKLDTAIEHQFFDKVPDDIKNPTDPVVKPA